MTLSWRRKSHEKIKNHLWGNWDPLNTQHSSKPLKHYFNLVKPFFYTRNFSITTFQSLKQFFFPVLVEHNVNAMKWNWHSPLKGDFSLFTSYNEEDIFHSFHTAALFSLLPGVRTFSRTVNSFSERWRFWYLLSEAWIGEKAPHTPVSILHPSDKPDRKQTFFVALKQQIRTYRVQTSGALWFILRFGLNGIPAVPAVVSCVTLWMCSRRPAQHSVWSWVSWA